MIVLSTRVLYWFSLCEFSFSLILFCTKLDSSVFISCSRTCFIFLYSALREKCSYSELFRSLFFRIQYKYGKIRTRITPNTDTFYSVHIFICAADQVESIWEASTLRFCVTWGKRIYFIFDIGWVRWI